MKKIILASVLALTFLAPSVSASEDILINDHVNTETYPEVDIVENDLKKEENYLEEIFGFDFDLDKSYEFYKNTGDKIYLYTENSLLSKDGLDISFRYGPYSKDYEKAASSYKVSKVNGLDVYISKANEFNGSKDSVFSADFKFDGLYYNLTIRKIGESDFVKILDNTLTKILYESLRGDASSEHIEDFDFKGDSSYAEGMYLPEMSVIGKYYYKDGEVVNPYGISKVGKISKEEKEKLLNDKAMKNLIAAYNKFYRTTINFYKYGEKHMDRWKKVKTMTDPVFKHVNKEKWVEIYNISTDCLADVKYYFYSRGLDDGDFTDEETIKAIGGDEKYILSLDKYKR